MNCLRCGREIAQEYTFCSECWKTVNQPLEPSPYLNTQINLLQKRLPSPSGTASIGKKPEKKSEKNRAGRGLTAFLCVLCVLILAFALVMSLFYFDQRNSRVELTQKVSELETQNAFLNGRISYIGESYVLINTEGERYYHALDCTAAQPALCQIIAARTAQKRGYQPCPYCH